MSLSVANEGPVKRLLLALSRSRFFTVSLFIHILVIVLFGGTVLFQAYVEPPDFEGAGGGFVDVAPAPPQPLQQQQTDVTPTNQQITPNRPTNAPKMKALTTINPSNATFSVPSIAPKIAPPGRTLANAAPKAPKIGNTGMTREVATEIKNFTQGWGRGRTGTGTGGSLRQRQFGFTAYIAKYRGGDWDSTIELRNGKIVTGSLPNLLYLMKKWSSDRIDANPDPVPLDLSSDQIFSVKPPFIFFTGHRDFKLTEEEVRNLQKYIRLGGAIWGDSSLAGRNSRFDIAFRREMKRVIPDVDKDFVPLPEDHPIYSRGYWEEIRTVVPGMNYYQEPIYAMSIYGEIAIFYTANNYGGMWQIGLLEDGQYDLRKDINGRYVAIDPQVFQYRNLYFRNLSPPSLVDAYKFGTNIVMHLLTRWEDKLRTVPNL